jgi:WD40 repeat protein
MAPILATGSEDGKAKLWRLLPDNLKATACVATLEVDRGEVNSLAFDPTGTLLATAGKGTKLWDCRQFQRKNVTDDFRAMQRVIAGKLVGNSVKGHSSMKSAITRRAASGRNGEDWGRVYGVDPDMANMVRAHLNHLYRMRIKDGNVVTPFRFESVRHNKLLNDPADQSSDSEKKENKDGGSRARPRSKSKSKSKSKMMKRKRTTLKRKSHK